MIIGVSIVDKHRPAGDRHVGTYMFEIDYPRDSHFDFLTVCCTTADCEESMRPYLGRLLKADEIPGAVDGYGKPRQKAGDPKGSNESPHDT